MAATNIPTPEELCAAPANALSDLFALVGLLPGGAQLLPQFIPGDVPTAAEVAASLLAELNAALTPLVPVFRIIECVLAVFEVVNAIPDAILSLNPAELIAKLSKLAECISFLAQLVPQLTVPLMVISIVNVVIVGLQGFRETLLQLIGVQNELQALDARIAQLLSLGLPAGAANLQSAKDCADANFAIQREAALRSICPLNGLLALLSLFLQLIGQQPIAAIDIGDALEPALDVVDAAVDLLEKLKQTLGGLGASSGC